LELSSEQLAVGRRRGGIEATAWLHLMLISGSVEALLAPTRSHRQRSRWSLPGLAAGWLVLSDQQRPMARKL
jgi:hypothetical protein